MKNAEDVALMRDAIKAVLASSKPWEASGFEGVINVSPLTPFEKEILKKYLSTAIAEHKRDIMRRELQKMLVGASDDSLAQTAYRIAHSDFAEKLKPQAANATIQQTTALQKLQEWREKEKMAIMYGQQNAASAVYYGNVFREP